MSQVIHVTSRDKAPKQEHYAIFKFFSVTQSLYAENDSSVDGCAYEAYLDRGAWLAEIEHLETKGDNYGRASWIASLVKPATIRKTVNVDVSP